MKVPGDDTISLAGLLAASSEALDLTLPVPSRDVTRTCFRVPRAILDESAAVARANGLSLSLLLNLLLDDYLRSQGRPGHAQLAPWYPDYAMRRTAHVD